MGTPAENKKYFAAQNFKENENAFKRYLSEVTSGIPEDEARAIVMDIFKFTDRRLDRVLETRAGAFSPKTASELEARALIYIQRVDNAIGSCVRHCDEQLEAFEGKSDNKWVDVELTEQVGGKFDGVKTKRLPVREAKKMLLEAKLSYAKQFGEALKAFKVDTIININEGAKLTDYSFEELEEMRISQKAMRTGKRVETNLGTN